MSLPADGVNANALAETTTIPTGKKLIFLDPDTNEGGIITLENLTKQILSNLATQTFNLDQGTKTLLAALNELNSKTRRSSERIVNDFVARDVEKTYVLDKLQCYLLTCAEVAGGNITRVRAAIITPGSGEGHNGLIAPFMSDLEGIVSWADYQTLKITTKDIYAAISLTKL